MTKMLYKAAGGNAGAKGEPYVINSGEIEIDGNDFDWIIVDDGEDSSAIEIATKDGWSAKATPPKATPPKAAKAT